MNSPTAASTVTAEELKSFHTIDRDMYCKLTFSLHHDPFMAIRIMAFWLWLESSKNCRNLIVYLHSLSFVVLNSLALETMTCIYCLDDSASILQVAANVVGIPYLRHLVNNDSFGLPYLINNRADVLESMQRISSTICARAFDDLLSQLLAQRLQYQTSGSVFNAGSPSSSPTVVVPAVDREQQQEHVIRSPRVDVANVTRPVVVGPRRNTNVSSSREEEEIMTLASSSPTIVDEPVNEQRTVVEHARLRTSNLHERTVFLTFSKGYPVTDTQLREFFTRRFGDIVEDLIMQEVPVPEEQPLFARMLVPSSNEVERVLGGQNRVKFTINGKHVYARKYVKKNPKAAAAAASTSHHHHSPPPSPAALV